MGSKEACFLLKAQKFERGMFLLKAQKFERGMLLLKAVWIQIFMTQYFFLEISENKKTA